jgi:hypothetical protein
VSRRVFLIDGKEYPDPDSTLPITGTRSEQAMYRDYFPGQLDNADVAQKARPDGTLEVTFKRRIGTKGVGRRVSHRTGANSSGEAVITVARIAGVLAGLPDDRPLVGAGGAGDRSRRHGASRLRGARFAAQSCGGSADRSNSPY